MQDSQTKLHRMHIMILIREHQQQHYAGHDESAVRYPRASGLTCWASVFLSWLRKGQVPLAPLI